MSRFPELLDRRHLMFLRAALGQGDVAAGAFRQWRASEKFEDTDDLAYRLMPLLAATAEAAGVQDEDFRRMRGVVKHIWLSNMVRIRDLIEARQALARAGIATLVFKGGALFARDPQFAAMRAAGDYDLLVHRKDARTAVEALRSEGFHSLGMHIELFSQSDFDRDIHAAAMSKSDSSKAIDLHWRAAVSVDDDRLTKDLFASAEPGKLFGHDVVIPGLAEHLLLAAIRPDPWEQPECLLRVIEIAQLLANCGGELDWGRFERMVEQYGRGWIAAPLLALAQEEAHAPIPDGLIDRIWRAAAPAPALQLAINRVPRGERTPWQDLLLAALDSLRRHGGRPFAWSRILARPARLAAVLADCADHRPRGWRATLQGLWQRSARRHNLPASDQICFVEGFSIPEPEGRWTDKEYAVIEASAGAIDSGFVRVTLDVVPFLPPGTDSLRVQLYAGGDRPRETIITQQHAMPFRLETEAPVLGSPGRIVIALHMPHRVRPRDIGLSVDHRLLGLFVRAVAVDDRPVFNPAGARP
jgi:hypothetical protein